MDRLLQNFASLPAQAAAFAGGAASIAESVKPEGAVQLRPVAA